MARTAQEAERFRDRELRIVATAREIAEQDGWPAVTVRRLSDAESLIDIASMQDWEEAPVSPEQAEADAAEDAELDAMVVSVDLA